jgi:uncharacterized RDD family membrane protein YckC
MAAQAELANRPRVRSMLPPAADEVQGRRAGVVTRTAVMVVDAAVVAGIVGVAYLVWAIVRFMRRPVDFSWPAVTYGTVLVAAGVTCVLYLTVAWSATGRSVGKRLFGLRVVGHEGERIRLIRSFLRAILCTGFPMLLYWAAVSSQNRSVQDLILRTSVIYDWRSRGHAVPAPGPADRAATASGEHAAGAGVDVAAAVTDEPDDGHPEPLPRLDGE